MASYDIDGNYIGSEETFYNCVNYGVNTSNPDNTTALNELITKVNSNGGGIIWIPNGTYNFVKDSSTGAMGGNAQNNVYLKSNVSIKGENLDDTILKLSGDTRTGCSLFGYFVQDNNNVPLVGCTFSNFTVDMSEETMATYTHKGKAFYVSGIKDCVFRDLRLISTPSTALGIDMLDNVVIDSVYVYQGGRQWSAGGNGGAGIGIGTGKWTDENYIIRNCICDSCGHFGIFLEDQGIFGIAKNQHYSKGQIIANNVVRNGRNYGIGLRGGRYVSITGNNIYSNTNGGVYLDYGADQSIISNNLISDTVHAVCFGNEDTTYPCTKIAVINNVFSGCTNGIVQQVAPTGSVLENNVTL